MSGQGPAERLTRDRVAQGDHLLEGFLMRRAVFGAMAVAACLSTGCFAIAMARSVKGSGTVKEETREVADFSGVEVGSSIQATIAIGSKSVKLSADDNLLPLIKTEVRDGRLMASLEPNVSIQTNNPIKLTLSTPKLDYVGASGASRVTAAVSTTDRFGLDSSGASHVVIAGLSTGALSVEGSGASNITLSGQCKSLKLGLSGASNLKAQELSADTVQVDISGASRGEVRTSGTVKGDVSGASSLHVAGSPSSHSVGISGASRVSFK
jgi:hypothetical protein